MSLDLFFRAKALSTCIDWLTTAQVITIIGDLRARDNNGNILSPAALQSIPGAVEVIQWDKNQAISTDTQSWVQIRLTGDAEVSDFTGPPIDTKVEFDRWEHSRLVILMSATGSITTHNGVAAFEGGSGNNKILVLRGSEMEAMGLKFHEFLGGDEF